MTSPRGLGATAKAAHRRAATAVEDQQDADRLADAVYGEALGLKPGRVAHRGPDPVAAITADIGESPAAKLRAVK
jgi:hypothetical protein